MTPAQREQLNSPCEGSCFDHSGEAVLVHVRHANHDWGMFRYCAEAIAEDRRRGLIVEVVKDGY